VAGLHSTALAGGIAGPWGRWNAGLHLLEAGPWRERQTALRWAPSPGPGAAGFDWSVGLEAREAGGQGRAERSWWPLADLTWQWDPLAAGLRLQAPVEGLGAGGVGGPGLESGLDLSWQATRHWSVVWRLERSAGRQREQAALVWRRTDLGLAAAWKAGRGWELAGRTDWRGLSLSLAWWVHPILPPTSSWSMEWTPAGRP
jgi:hypothetical protein